MRGGGGERERETRIIPKRKEGMENEPLSCLSYKEVGRRRDTVHLRSMAGERRGIFKLRHLCFQKNSSKEYKFLFPCFFAGKKINIPEKDIFPEDGLRSALPTRT